MSLRVEKLYGFAALQGPPRTGRRALGVPVGGPFDLASASWANARVGNGPDAPVVELTMAHLEWVAETPITIALAGASEAIWVDGVEAGQSAQVPAGARVMIPAPTAGLRSYLATPGGWRGTWPEVSGGVGDTVDVEPSEVASGPIRVVEGPERDVFPSDAFDHAWTVSLKMDRAGIRLEGRSLPPGPTIVSEPVVPGTIQVTPDGGLLLLGPDGPTIGGYPRLAVVIVADLPRVAQWRPGDEVVFVPLNLAEARSLTPIW